MRLGSLVALLALGGCSFDATIPSSSRIGCGPGQTACPSGLRCDLALGLCVSAQSTDSTVAVHDLLLQPSQGNAATTFTLTFQVSDTPGAPVAATATLPDGGPTLNFACEACTTQADCRCLFSADPEQPPPDGVYQVGLLVTDPFGGAEAPVDAGSFLLKTQPPPPPSLGADGGIRYHRAPWGEAPDFSTPSMELEDVGSALQEDGTLVVYADPDGGGIIGSYPVMAGQSAPVVLPAIDHPRLWVDVLDVVGNVAPGGPFPVREVDWFGTLGNKVAGSLTENPNSCFGRPAFEPRLVQGDDPQTEQGAATGPAGGGSTVVGAGAWRLRSQGTPEMAYSSAAYDPTRGQIVSYGAGLLSQDQTWQFDDVDWSRAPNVVGSLGVVYEPALAYDARRDRIVLFGGFDENNASLCETGEWDGQHWQRAATCSPSNTAPPEGDGGVFTGNLDGGPGFALGTDGGPLFPAGSNTRLAYSGVRGTVVMIDNQGLGWDWDGAQWTPRIVPDAGRDNGFDGSLTWYAGAVFQPLSDGGEQLVLTGAGTAANPNVYANETWIGIDTGAGYLWSMPFASDCSLSSPGCGVSRLTVDPVSGELVQLTQSAFNDTSLAQLWRWDGDPAHPWRLAGTLADNYIAEIFGEPGGIAGARIVAVTAHDDSSATDIGSSGTVYDTFACAAADAGCALLHGPQTSLPPRPSDAMPLAFDDQGNGLLFGGIASLSGPILDDTWQWNGADWTGWVPTGATPPPRMWSGLGYDPVEADFWLFGGEFLSAPIGGGALNFGDLASLTDAWSFSSKTGWTERLAGADGGPIEGQSAMIWLADAGLPPGFLLVQPADFNSGVYSLATAANGTAEVTGLSTPDSAGTPAGYGELYVAWDALLHEPVAFGTPSTAASGATAQLCAFDLGTDSWEIIGPTLGDSIEAPVFDSAANHLLLIGGSQIWMDPTFDGGSVLPQAAPQGQGIPGERYNQALAFDSFRGRTLMFGGNLLDNIFVNETWELSLASEEPGEVCRFPIDAVEQGATLTQVSVQVSAAAVHAPEGAPIPWALQLWRGGHFTAEATCSGSCPTGQTYVSTDPARITSLLADGNQVGVAIVPGEANGEGTTNLTVSSMQVEVSYELP